MKMRFSATSAALLAASASASATNVRSQFMASMREASDRRAGLMQKMNLSRDLLSVAEPIEGSRRLDQGDDAYASSGIDLTKYALKYMGCQNIHTYSDELAANAASSVLQMDRFVVVRLCPSDSCSSYNKYGCNSGFGDYTIPLDQYLYYMSSYYIKEYQTYCETCSTCTAATVTTDDAVAAGDDAGDDAVAAAGDDQVNGDDGNNARRRLANDDYYGADGDYYGDDQYANANANNNAAAGDDAAVANDDNVECPYLDACQSYQSACKDYSAKALDFTSFFQCSKFNLGNTVGYVGPHCASDGKTIGFGIYKDEYCNKYVDDLADLASHVGLDYSDEYMQAYHSNSCISCLASDGYDLYTDDNAGNSATALCSTLYQASAKCNKRMSGSDATDYASEQQEENENRVCNFITNLIQNTYDEEGEIILEGGGWFSYMPSASEIPSGQKWWLSISIFLVLGLIGYSCYLHRAIASHRFAWSSSKRASTMPGPGGDVNRMQSGILMGRSRSEVNYDLQGGLLT